jgi:2'-5' RNA ligase
LLASSIVGENAAPARSAERLFFALWPDDETRGRLARVQRKLAPPHGRRVHPADVHLTVVFLGPATPGQRNCAEQVAAEVVAREASVPFELTLDRVGSFPRARVFWCGASVCPAPLLELVLALSRGLADCGFAPERRPYRPHVTLARKARPVVAQELLQPIRWAVDGLVLVTGTGGVPRYRVLRRWELGGPGGGPRE